MKDYSQIDEHVWALLNGQADGELSKEELQELNGLLADSQELREAQAELSSLTRVLDEAPEKSPPGYLHNAIISTVRLPVNGQHRTSPRSFRTWLTEHWLGPVFALTAGVLMTVGIYETNPDTLNTGDTSLMSGSIIGNHSSQDGNLLDRLQIEQNSINGSAQVRKLGQDLLVDVVLNSAQPYEFKLDYTANELAFYGLASLQNQIDGMSVGAGQLSVESSGEQHFTLKFRDTQTDMAANSLPMKVDILVNANLVQQAELKTKK